MNLTSEVFWKDAAKERPRDDSTVLIFNREWSIRVELGHLRDDSDWQTDDGLVLDNIGDCIAPTHWAYLPDGPNN